MARKKSVKIFGGSSGKANYKRLKFYAPEKPWSTCEK